MMDYMDTDDDGYLSLQELIDYLNNDREQNGEEPMSSEDEEGTANWFYSGDTDGDDLLSLDEFTQLLEATGDGDGDGDDDVSWMDYDSGYCEWEGDVDGDENVWYCKYSEDDEDWDTWWYYCEDHEDDGWHCTDDFGQSEDFEWSSGGDEWSDSGDDSGDDDDDGPPTPEEAMYVTDTNGDDNMSLDEFVDFWNSDNPDAQIDSDNSFLTTSDVSDLIEMCDYDGNEMIDINEMQCFIDNLMDMIPDGDDPSADEVFEWMNTDGDGQVTPSEWADFANTTGDIIDGDDFDNLNYMMDMYDYDESGGLDMYEFAELWDEINDDDDDGDGGDDGDDEPFHVTMMVIDQTLNAPISDFEVRFLVDCGEPDEEGNEPPISDCTVVASNGLTEGFATVDPEITEYEFTYQYLDLDGDGMISTMDTLVIDNLMPGVKVELYDTWADQYTSDSYATSQVPGFGALMAVVVLLGAAFATRRD
jgi:PGF-CTERM protein